MLPRATVLVGSYLSFLGWVFLTHMHVHLSTVDAAAKIIVESDDKEVTRRPVKRWSLIFIRRDYSPIRNSSFFTQT